MTDVKIVLFSRTQTKDYHWIFADDSMVENEKNFIIDDLRNNKILGLNKKYLIVRRLQNKIIFYRIVRTENLDMYSRKIFAIQGMVFSGVSYDIIKRLLPYEAAYAFCFQLDNIDWKRISITNVEENISFPMSVSIDLIIEKYKECKCVADTVQTIENFVIQNSDRDFIVTQDSIISIDGFNFQADVNNTQSFNDLLERTGKPQEDMSKSTIKEKKEHLHLNNLRDLTKKIWGVKGNK